MYKMKREMMKMFRTTFQFDNDHFFSMTLPEDLLNQTLETIRKGDFQTDIKFDNVLINCKLVRAVTFTQVDK
jgi:hypothetical protein